MTRALLAFILVLTLIFSAFTLSACGNNKGDYYTPSSSSGVNSGSNSGSNGGSSSSSDSGNNSASNGNSNGSNGSNGSNSSNSSNGSDTPSGGDNGNLSSPFIDVTSAGCGLESIYLEWSPVTNASGYAVYCDGVKVDKQLIRKYPSYYRVDVIGITASEHTVKVLPIIDGQEVQDASATYTATPPAHVREGFAFANGYSATGAYNMDGTLKPNAQVIYVTKDNAKTVTANVNGAVQTGLQTILDAKQKKDTSNDVLCIRIIGMVSKEDLDHISSSSEGLQIKGRSAETEMNITFEGVGNDATINGFGFLVRNCKNVEIRNIGIINFMDDGISVDTDNANLWLHNNDFFYGNPGGDADQNKGDGSLDIKKSHHITVSYNHFWESGKACLLDAGTGEGSDYITYHHNWFDHSDSRHPRVRNANVHVYNNYYDGVAKYGIGAAGGGSSVFSEANYFRNTKCPMLTSMQGSDISADKDGKGTFSGEDGGVIKSFGDVMVGNYLFVPYSQNNVEYDAYVASTRDEVVPSSVASKKGGHTYSNFDTSSQMYSYTPHTAEQAKDNVTAYAGRVQGGDIKWTFTDKDDADYEINSGLKSAVTNYKPTVILSADNGGNGTNTGNGNTGSGNGNTGDDNNGGNGGNGSSDDNGGNGNNGGSVVIPEGGIVHNFTTDGTSSSFFTISGSTSTSKGDVSYNGLTLTKCLKVSSKASITFTAPSDGVLTLVFNSSCAGYTIYINGENSTEIPSDGIVTIEVVAGMTYTITKNKSESFLYYMVFMPNA